MAISRSNMPKQMEGKMKTCAACKNPQACKAAGKCLAKGMMGGGKVKGYKEGKMVRGAGCAKKGVRKCKMR